MFFFDPLYFVFALPALIFGLWAQWRVRSAMNRYSQVVNATRFTGAEIAQRILASSGLQNVRVELSQGFLSDHYDPGAKVLRLSPDVYHGQSIAAAGIAAHESGHALQDQTGYLPLRFRSAMVPTVQIGSWLGPIVFMVGLFTTAIFGQTLAWAGLMLFAATAVFALVTLPVEFDASRRAKELLETHGYVFATDMQGIHAVLNAAALTYVAGAAQAISTLLYYAFLLTGLRQEE
ncbi:MAG: zinc metallopeptidase [Chloroflexi bacterium]|nr:MAG: zinc metallopeptidase [Chloroflexota bacterium]